jgi:hypothetical protein
LQDYPKWARTVEQINAAGAMNHGVWKYYKVNIHPASRGTNTHFWIEAHVRARIDRRAGTRST